MNWGPIWGSYLSVLFRGPILWGYFGGSCYLGPHYSRTTYGGALIPGTPNSAKKRLFMCFGHQGRHYLYTWSSKA